MPVPPITARAWMAASHLERGDVLRARMVLTMPEELMWPQEALFLLAWEAGRRAEMERLNPEA